MAEHDSLQQIERIERLVEQLEHCGAPELQAAARELVDGVLEFHRLGLGRLLALLAQRGPEFQAAVAVAAADDLFVGNLLMLHHLHPHDLRQRIVAAIDKIRPLLPAPETIVEIIEAAPERVHVQFTAAADPATFVAMQRTLENALLLAAPDAAVIECRAAPSAERPGYLPLPVVTTLKSVVS